jgi:hypothetical protein
MQMLSAGGVACSGPYPNFEDPRAMQGLDLEWLSSFHGAVKILDPHRYLPSGFVLYDARGIWLDRDRKQQAISWCKISRDVVGRKNVSREDVPRVAKRLKESRKPGVQKLVDVTGRGPLCLTFEGILAAPRSAAEKMAKFLEMELDVARMAAQVIPRTSACINGLLENDMVRMGQRAVENMVRQQRGMTTENEGKEDESKMNIVRQPMEIASAAVAMSHRRI